MHGTAERVGLAIALIAVAGAASAQIPPGLKVTKETLPSGGFHILIQTPNPPQSNGQEPAVPPSVTFTKAVNRHQVPVGGDVQYRFAITNDGPSDLHDVLMTDTALVQAIVAGRLEPFAELDGVELPPGASATIEITVFIPDPMMQSFFRATVDPLSPDQTFALTLTLRAGSPIGGTVSNQAALQLNCDELPCPNPVVGTSDDPDTPTSDDPTIITIISPFFAPAMAPLGLAGSAAGLLGLGTWRLRARRGMLRARR